MNRLETQPRHPIRVVSQRTGLTPATIRAWERRYSAVEPGRSDGGQRMYSDRDVARLTMLTQLTEGGRSISMVAGLPDEEVAALLLEDRTSSGFQRASGPTSDQNDIVSATYQATLDLNAEGLESLLWRAAMDLEGADFLDGVVAPLLVRIGEGWVAGELNPGQEHLASDVIDRCLARLVEPARFVDGPGIVVATLPDERHGLGARLVSAAASVDGWRVTYLGTDLPVADIVSTANAVGASAVAISMVSRERVAESARELSRLRDQLHPTVAILVGGAAASLLDVDRLPAGIAIFDGLDGLRRFRNGAGR